MHVSREKQNKHKHMAKIWIFHVEKEQSDNISSLTKINGEKRNLWCKSGLKTWLLHHKYYGCEKLDITLNINWWYGQDYFWKFCCIFHSYLFQVWTFCWGHLWSPLIINGQKACVAKVQFTCMIITKKYVRANIHS